jgi:hypothetical protein
MKSANVATILAANDEGWTLPEKHAYFQLMEYHMKHEIHR